MLNVLLVLFYYQLNNYPEIRLEAIRVISYIPLISGSAPIMFSAIQIANTLTVSGNVLLANANGATLKTFHNTLDDGSGNAIFSGTTTLTNATVNGTLISLSNTILANSNGATLKTFHSTLDDGSGNELISGDIISLKHIIGTGDSGNTQYTINSNNQITTVTKVVNGITITKNYVYNSNGYITSYSVQIGSNTPVTYNVSYNSSNQITAIVQA